MSEKRRCGRQPTGVQNESHELGSANERLLAVLNAVHDAKNAVAAERAKRKEVEK